MSKAIGQAVFETVRALEGMGEGLDFRRMHRIVVAMDFGRELAELSTATASGNLITHTNEEYATAMAKVLLLPQGEDYEIVPVVGAKYALALIVSGGMEDADEEAEYSPSELRRLVLHSLHHELCHVHDYNKQIDAFGTVMLSPYSSGKDAYIGLLAEACWSEYIANLMSAPTADVASVGGMVESLGDAITRTKPDFNSEILAYRVGHVDLQQLLGAFQRHGVFLAKSAAYVLGYMDGLNVSLEELSADTSDRLSGSYFEPTWNAMHEALRGMRQRYPDDWQDLGIYGELAEALERYYVEMGLVLSTTKDGQLYVHVPLRSETTP